MALTLGDLISASQADNHEPDFSWTARDDWVRWANDAIDIVNEAAGIVEDEKRFTLQEDKKVYKLPEDLIRIIDVRKEDPDDDDEDPIGLDPVDRYVHLQQGQVWNFTWHLRQNKDGSREFVLNQAPGSSDENDIITIRYIAEHELLSDDGDEVPAPRRIRPHIVDYMNYRFKLQDDELGQAQFNQQEWRESVRSVIRMIRRDSAQSGSKLVDKQYSARKNYRNQY